MCWMFLYEWMFVCEWAVWCSLTGYAVFSRHPQSASPCAAWGFVGLLWDWPVCLAWAMFLAFLIWAAIFLLNANNCKNLTVPSIQVYYLRSARSVS